MNFKYAIVFADGESLEIVHTVCTETPPNVATLKEIFDELVNDEEFGCGDVGLVDKLEVHIVDYDSFIEHDPEIAADFEKTD